jgi:hypothetical protein
METNATRINPKQQQLTLINVKELNICETSTYRSRMSIEIKINQERSCYEIMEQVQIQINHVTTSGSEREFENSFHIYSDHGV